MQAKIKRCDICAGSKYLLGIGGMREDCYQCKGSGIIEDIPFDELFPPLQPKKDRDKDKVKRGRKPSGIVL